MSEGEGKRSWVYGQPEEDDRDALYMIAGSLGKHINEVVVEAIQFFISHWAADEDNPDVPHARLRAMFLESKRSQNRFAMLKQLAYTWQTTQDDGDYEMLTRACELASVEVDVVLETINKSSEYVPKVISTTVSDLQAAEMWLVEELEETGRMYAVAFLREESEKKGFKWHTVTAAKRRLKILSAKNGMSWYWIRGSTADEILSEVTESQPESDQARVEADDQAF